MPSKSFISHLGYIKRTPLSEFHAQNRGGVGSKGTDTRDEDFVEHIYPATMHNTMMFFTQKGKCYWLKVYEIPEGTKNSKGRAIQNLLNIDTDDAVNAYEKAMALKKLCSDKLAAATLKVEKIELNKDGSLSTAPLDNVEA